MSVSMTMNGAVLPVLAMYVVAAEEQVWRRVGSQGGEDSQQSAYHRCSVVHLLCLSVQMLRIGGAVSRRVFRVHASLSNSSREHERYLGAPPSA